MISEKAFICSSFHSNPWTKLALQSGNTQLESKYMFCPAWPWHWQMTLNSNRASLLCYVKLCASFCSHQWIQTGDAVRKCPIWVKIGDYLCRVTLKFDRWPWNAIGHLSYAKEKLCASFHYHMWIQTGITVRKRLNWALTSVALTLHLLLWHISMDITSVISNNSWKFHDDTMMGT